MTATAKQILHRKVDEIEAALTEARFVHIRPRILIHEAAPEGSPPCRCCGSTFARTVEERALPEIAIDCATGRRHVQTHDLERWPAEARKTLHPLGPEAWATVCEDADSHDVPFRLSRTQADAVLSEDDRHILASGGNRSAKTTAGLIFLALQWLLRGGDRRRFWLTASTLPKAYRLLEKLFRGTDVSPPILPRALVRHMPETHRASSLLTELVDGSFIDLKYFDGDPGAERLKSDSIVCALVDEAAHLPTPDSLTALKGRCLDGAGRLFLATTPRPDHFLLKVVEDSQAFDRLPEDDERRRTGAHDGARWRTCAFAIPSNPWLDPESVRKDMAAADRDDPSFQRDFLGMWVSNSGALWRDFSLEKHVHLDEARTVRDMRGTLLPRCGKSTEDITPKVVHRLFQKRRNPHFRMVQATNTQYVLASDFNCHPMSSVVLQVVADPAALDDRDRWHVFVHDCIQSAHSNSLAHATRLVDTAWARQWSPTAKESPFVGAGMICDPQAIHRDPTSHKHGRDPHGLAETLGRLGIDARAPQYKVSDSGEIKPVHLARYDSHTLIHKLLREGRLHFAQRAIALHESFLQQQDSGDGICPKTVSHTKSDKLASPMDALRYGVWAIFHG